MAELVIVGAGGFGRNALDVFDAMKNVGTAPWKSVVVVDDAPSPSSVGFLAARGVEVLGGVDEAISSLPAADYVIAINGPRTKQAISERFEASGWSPASLVHPTVTRGFGTKVGAGAVLCAGARLASNVTLGRHVHLNFNTTVGHDTVLGDFASVNPLASISGECVLGDRLLMGAGAVVLNRLTIGTDVVVGGSACVVSDLPDGVTVKGVPAR